MVGKLRAIRLFLPVQVVEIRAVQSDPECVVMDTEFRPTGVRIDPYTSTRDISMVFLFPCMQGKP